MIKWYDFQKQKPKKGWYLVYMDTVPISADDGPETTLSDLVCVAHFDPKAPEHYQWHSAIYDTIAVTHWAKINLPTAVDVPK